MRSSPPHFSFAQERFGAVILGGATGRGDAVEAVSLAGGRVVSELDWEDVADALGRYAGPLLVLVEASGTADDVLERVLPRIDSAAAAMDWPVIVALESAQIDIVSAGMFGANITMLCEPTIADRVAALATVSSIDAQALSSAGVREGEATRLKLLNEEVARIAEVLAKLSRREETPVARATAEVAERRKAFIPADETGMEPVEPQEIRQVIRARRMREQFLGEGLFEDPAWDMLLDLFAADLERVRVSVSSLCIAAAVAPTTALRWIGKLSDAGLLERQPDPFDRRRAYIVLTVRARTGMAAYAAGVKRAGLALA